MPLNIASGNMYSFVTHTFNLFKGECKDHDCLYCYMKEFKLNPLRFDRSELKTDLGGAKNFIFIGSSTDAWAKSVPKEWIIEMLEFVNKFEAKILFQSKYPPRFLEFTKYLPPKERLVLGTTIETNRIYEQMGKAISPAKRAEAMAELSKDYVTMVTTEPLMAFDKQILIPMLVKCNPSWVNVGFDSKSHSLPEPNRGLTVELIVGLRSAGIRVIPKSNSVRILGEILYKRYSRDY